MDAAGNTLSGSIPRQLFTLPNLSSLFLSSLLSGTIPPECASLTVLKALGLWGDKNTLSGTVIQLTSLSHLSVLTLGGGGTLSGTIPEQITALTALQFFHLNSTSVSGSVPSHLPTSTAYMLVSYNPKLSATMPLLTPSLVSVDLSHNRVRISVEDGSLIAMCCRCREHCRFLMKVS